MRSKLLAAAAAALALLASPASASPPSDSHDTPVGSCGFVVVNNDPLNQQGGHFEGEVDCEVSWLTRGGVAPPTTTHSSVTVSLQTSATPGTGVLASCTVTSTGVGFVVLGACVVAFTVTPSQAVWFCVHYNWIEPTDVYTYHADEDPVLGGRQCGLAIRVRNLSIAGRSTSPPLPV